MSYGGHILCRKCRRVLHLGKHKNGRFQPGVAEPQLAAGVLLFITEHFPHGEVTVMGDAPLEHYLESCSDAEWPIGLFVDVDELNAVRLVERDSLRAG